MPKGILVVNTWRELPLGERQKDDFLLRRFPARAEYWRKLLLKTKGILRNPRLGVP